MGVYLQLSHDITYIALFRYHDYSKASARILLYVMIKEDIWIIVCEMTQNFLTKSVFFVQIKVSFKRRQCAYKI